MEQGQEAATPWGGTAYLLAAPAYGVGPQEPSNSAGLVCTSCLLV
jgi:hypothetical protein